MNSRATCCILTLCCCARGGADKSASDGGPHGPVTLHAEKHSIAGGTGSFTIEGLECAAACDVTYQRSTTATLATADASFQSWAIDCPGDDCWYETSATLSLPMDLHHSVKVTFRPPVNYIFQTSTTHTANMGGLAGADAICAQSATQAGLGGKQWIAWLSTSKSSALSRLGDARGWMRTDGMPVIDSVFDLASGELFYPPRLDEFGNDVALSSKYGFIPVWTGTDYKYDSTEFTCDDWTSTSSALPGGEVGNGSGGGIAWSMGVPYACTDWMLPVYCLEKDYATPVDPPPAPAGARAAFISTPHAIAAGGGIADADAWCMADAAAAGVSGTFRALIADVNVAPIDRFDTSKGPWYRLDGVPVVRAAADFATPGGPILNAPLDLQADGHTRVWPGTVAWVGFNAPADDYTQPGTDETTCRGWTSNSSSDRGVTSIATFSLRSYLRWPNWYIPPCSEPNGRFYCLQQ